MGVRKTGRNRRPQSHNTTKNICLSRKGCSEQVQPWQDRIWRMSNVATVPLARNTRHLRKVNTATEKPPCAAHRTFTRDTVHRASRTNHLNTHPSSPQRDAGDTGLGNRDFRYHRNKNQRVDWICRKDRARDRITKLVELRNSLKIQEKKGWTEWKKSQEKWEIDPDVPTLLLQLVQKEKTERIDGKTNSKKF